MKNKFNKQQIKEAQRRKTNGILQCNLNAAPSFSTTIAKPESKETHLIQKHN